MVRPILVQAAGSTLLTAIALGQSGDQKTEAWLQAQIDKHPEILPLSEIEPSLGPAISICTELQTAHGYVDNLLLTAAGDIILVEVKLWRNPESRRTVVAQALDYASCLFEMGYSELEQAVLGASFPNRSRPQRLFDLVRESGATEAHFIDAVSHNLARGKALILVVGDGIRSETRRLLSLMQSHTHANFTFALVELQLYKVPKSEDLLVIPGTLVRTEILPRATSIGEGKIAGVRAPIPPKTSTDPQDVVAELASSSPALETILPDLIARFATLGVYDEHKRSLSFKYELPSGQTITLGYITRDGKLWTDTVCREPFGPYHDYIQSLATILGLQVAKSGANENNWSIRDNGGGIPEIAKFLDKIHLWPPVAERVIQALKSSMQKSA